jgi:hypothetical protein
MLEYALLLAIVVAAWLIMQMFIKRHYQGGLKESAEKMGEMFSASGTTITKTTTLTGDQIGTEEVASNATLQTFATEARGSVFGSGAFSLTERTGGRTAISSNVTTDAAKDEKVRWNEYQSGGMIQER